MCHYCGESIRPKQCCNKHVLVWYKMEALIEMPSVQSMQGDRWIHPFFKKFPPILSEEGGKFYKEKEGNNSRNVRKSWLYSQNPPCFSTPRLDTVMPYCEDCNCVILHTDTGFRLAKIRRYWEPSPLWKVCFFPPFLIFFPLLENFHLPNSVIKINGIF